MAVCFFNTFPCSLCLFPSLLSPLPSPRASITPHKSLQIRVCPYAFPCARWTWLNITLSRPSQSPSLLIGKNWTAGPTPRVDLGSTVRALGVWDGCRVAQFPRFLKTLWKSAAGTIGPKMDIRARDDRLPCRVAASPRPRVPTSVSIQVESRSGPSQADPS